MESVAGTVPHGNRDGGVGGWNSASAETRRGLLANQVLAPANLVPADAWIMIVDDDPINIRMVEKYLRSAGYRQFIAATDSVTVVERIQWQQPDVLILDIVMPGVSGLEILHALRTDPVHQHLPILILSAAEDEATKIEALRAGATDFLPKPVFEAELVTRIRNMLILKAHFDHLAGYSAQLEHEVRMRTEQLDRASEELVHVLACAAEHRDHETGNHVLRVGRVAKIIARQLGFTESRAELLEQAAVLHDVGKIGIPDSILLKRGRLTPDEVQVMRNHCVFGHNILHARPNQELGREDLSQTPGARSPMLELAASIAMSHHERWDGAGYPQGLVGAEIPIEARITAVADVFDALHSERQYKPALPLEECLHLLEEGRGRHFDPRVLDAFFARQDEIVAATIELAD